MKWPKLSSIRSAATGTWWLKPLIIGVLVLLAVFSLKSFGRDIKEFFFGNPEVVKAQGETVVQEELNEGLTDAATQGMEVVVRVERERLEIDRITVRNDNDIKQAPDAGTRAPGVAAALHDALCLRAAYRAEVDCAPLPGAPGGERPAGRDAGSR